MRINWNNYVDHIFCIHKIEYDYRYNDLIETLKYADVLNSMIFDFIYDYDDNYKFKNAYECLFYNHYLAAKYCVKFNWNKILVFEDDIRILKNKNIIIEYLDNLYNNFDICLFDYQIPFEKIGDIDNDIKINNYYSKYKKMYSAAAYIISNTAAKKFVYDYENIMTYELNDFYFNKTFKNKIHSNLNLFIQYEYPNRSAKKYNTKNNYIERNKLNLEDYYLYLNN